jgi:hypothetical protein
MSTEAELDPTDYHLHLMIERMQRDGRSEAAIDKAVRIASGWKRRAKTAGAHDNHPGDRHSTEAGQGQ